MNEKVQKMNIRLIHKHGKLNSISDFAGNKYKYSRPPGRVPRRARARLALQLKAGLRSAKRQKTDNPPQKRSFPGILPLPHIFPGMLPVSFSMFIKSSR